MDIVIDDLVIEEDRPAHIAKHDVAVEEVLEVTRPASREERDFYNEFTLQYIEGGEKDEQR